jgi:hypothetical protein
MSPYKFIMSQSTQPLAGLASFRAKLRIFEFAKEGSSRALLKKTAYKVIDPSRYANAGPIHVALTFGPLMIENGVPS